eukprot:1152272-Pelagomonas_calceolata.AAC.18
MAAFIPHSVRRSCFACAGPARTNMKHIDNLYFTHTSFAGAAKIATSQTFLSLCWTCPDNHEAYRQPVLHHSPVVETRRLQAVCRQHDRQRGHIRCMPQEWVAVSTEVKGGFGSDKASRCPLKYSVAMSLQGMPLCVRPFERRFLIARTAETLLMGDLESCNLSEIPWSAAHGELFELHVDHLSLGSAGTEKFIFDNETVCVIYYAGELTLVAYGRNEILGVCRTEHVHPTLLSVVAQQLFSTQTVAARVSLLPKTCPKAGGTVSDGRHMPESRTVLARLAYLIDMQTIRIMDLLTNSTLATINHDTRVDWLVRVGMVVFCIVHIKAACADWLHDHLSTCLRWKPALKGRPVSARLAMSFNLLLRASTQSAPPKKNVIADKREIAFSQIQALPRVHPHPSFHHSCKPWMANATGVMFQYSLCKYANLYMLVLQHEGFAQIICDQTHLALKMLFHPALLLLGDELNPRGTHLLFRDKKRQLSLFHITKQERTTLLNYSGYVQWVPQKLMKRGVWHVTLLVLGDLVVALRQMLLVTTLCRPLNCHVQKWACSGGCEETKLGICAFGHVAGCPCFHLAACS